MIHDPSDAAWQTQWVALDVRHSAKHATRDIVIVTRLVEPPSGADPAAGAPVIVSTAKLGVCMGGIADGAGAGTIFETRVFGGSHDGLRVPGGCREFPREAGFVERCKEAHREVVRRIDPGAGEALS